MKNLLLVFSALLIFFIGGILYMIVFSDGGTDNVDSVAKSITIEGTLRAQDSFFWLETKDGDYTVVCKEELNEDVYGLAFSDNNKVTATGIVSTDKQGRMSIKIASLPISIKPSILKAANGATLPESLPKGQLKVPETEKAPKKAKMIYPVIKGFYLGMPKDEAIKKAESLIEATFNKMAALDTHLNDESKKLSIMIFPIGTTNGFVKLLKGFTFVFDKKNSLVGMMLGSQFIDKAFNVSNLDVNEFAQELINNYAGIDSFKPMIFKNRDVYGYKNLKEGYLIIVDNDKTITMKKIVKNSEQKFD